MATPLSSIAPATRVIRLRRSQRLPLLIAAVLFIALSVMLGQQYGVRHALLLPLGGAFGLVLYHAAFGFTGAWRAFLADRRGMGVRAQMLMLGVACALFFPALSAGQLFEQNVYGFVAPVGTSVAVGAFIFGIGMQLGGGCASGTLFTAGGGNLRMVVTLVFFVIGSVSATAHLPWWFDLPALRPYSLPIRWGWPSALALNLAVFAAIAYASVVLERRRHGRLIAAEPVNTPWRNRVLHGPWPLFAGGIALALLNFLTLYLAGRPWGITQAFALWGAKLFHAVGIDIAAWPYWANQGGAAAIERPLLHDVTSVMNIGIVIGALLAASLAGRFAPSLKLPWRSLMAAALGGLLLGYGARLAFGCNIGAFFSGIASGSLHGWLWLVAALAGNAVGVRLRPLFALPVERAKAGTR